MKLNYVVHSYHEVAVPVRAMFNNKDIDGTMPGCVVEVVDDQSRHGHTFHFIPGDDEDMAPYRALFRPGAMIEVRFDKAGGKT